MADTIYKWRIWCSTDGRWVEGWSKELPSQCFENHTHTIDTSKTTSIDSISQNLPLIDLGNRLSVHSTPRPMSGSNALFSYWTGAGDDLVNHVVGGGPPTIFSLTTGVASQSIEVEFDPIFGQVFIHEGYFMCQGAELGDYVDAEIVAHASPLSSLAPHKDLVLDNDGFALYSTGGSDTGTTGFAGTPRLIPRYFTKDGDWDYNGTSLTPNFLKTGMYKIKSTEYIVHRFMNHVGLLSTSSYIRMVSAESTELPAGYFIRITCYNVSNSDWQGMAMITAFRDSTAHP